MENEIAAQELETVKAIEEKIFSRINIGIDWSELDVLDDVNAGRRAIEELGVKITSSNPEMAATILEIANSIYFGCNPLGNVPDFFDAVIRMGAIRVKTLVFALALFSLGKGPEARMRAAKSAGISVLSKMIAEDMGLNDELVRKAEAGGLLSQLGKSVFMKARELGMPVSDEIIRKYETHLAASIIGRLKLDPFLKKTVDLSVVEFDEHSFSLTGIIKLAEALTEDSFKRHGKLVLKSPMPDTCNVLAKTPGDAIEMLFTALGVAEYLDVRVEPTMRQREAAARKEKKTKNLRAGA